MGKVGGRDKIEILGSFTLLCVGRTRLEVEVSWGRVGVWEGVYLFLDGFFLGFGFCWG